MRINIHNISYKPRSLYTSHLPIAKGGSCRINNNGLLPRIVFNIKIKILSKLNKGTKMRRDRLSAGVLWGMGILLTLAAAVCAMTLMLAERLRLGKERIVLLSWVFGALVSALFFICTVSILTHYLKIMSERRTELECRQKELQDEHREFAHDVENEQITSGQSPVEMSRNAENMASAQKVAADNLTETVLRSDSVITSDSDRDEIEAVEIEDSDAIPLPAVILVPADAAGPSMSTSEAPLVEDRESGDMASSLNSLARVDHSNTTNREIITHASGSVDTKKAPHVFSFHHDNYCRGDNPPEAVNRKRVVVIEVPETDRRKFSDLMNLFETPNSGFMGLRRSCSTKHSYEFKFSRPESHWYLVNKVMDLKGLEATSDMKIYLSLASTKSLREEVIRIAERKFEDATAIRVVFPKNKAPFLRITSCENQRSEILTKIYNDYFLKGDERGDEFFKRYARLLMSCISMHAETASYWISHATLASTIGSKHEMPREYQKQLEKGTDSITAPLEPLGTSMGFDIINNHNVFRGIIQYWRRTKLSRGDNRTLETRILNTFIQNSIKFSKDMPKHYNMPTAGFLKFLLSTMSSPMELPEYFVEGPKLEDVITMDRQYLFACFDIENGKTFADALEKRQNKQGTCLHILSLLYSGKAFELVRILNESADNVWIAAFLLTAAKNGTLPGQSSPIFQNNFFRKFNDSFTYCVIRNKVSECLRNTYQAQTNSSDHHVRRNDEALEEDEVDLEGAMLDRQVVSWRERGPETWPSEFVQTLHNLAYGQELHNLLNFINGEVILSTDGQSTLSSVLQKLAGRSIESMASNPIWNQGCREKTVEHDFSLELGKKSILFHDTTERPSSAITSHVIEEQHASTAAELHCS